MLPFATFALNYVESTSLKNDTELNILYLILRSFTMGALSIWHWLILLVVVALVFGTSKLKNVGKDLGGAIKGFKEGMKEAQDEFEDKPVAKESSIEKK